MSDKRKTVPRTFSLQPEVDKALTERCEALGLDASFMVNIDLARSLGLVEVSARLQARMDAGSAYARGDT